MEAGCGQGIFVNALKELGYQIEGIDFDKETVKQINGKFPNLKITVGDIFNLNYPENNFSGYISLGAIEHYENDWEKPIGQSRRILEDGGILFLSVPYFNYVKRLINPIKDLFKKSDGKFYQYLFKSKEIIQAVKSERFKIISVDFYGKSKTLMELPLLGRMFKSQYRKIKSAINEKNDKKNNDSLGTFIKKLIFGILPNKWFAHMVVVIAKK